MCRRINAKREAVCAGIHRLAKQPRHLFDFARSGGSFRGLFADDIKTQGGERHQEGRIQGDSAPRDAREIITKAFPLPGRAPNQNFVRQGFDIDQIPGDNFFVGWTAWRDPYATISHQHGCYSMPTRGSEYRVPANLRIVMSMRIDESGRHDEILAFYFAAGAAAHGTNLGNFSGLDGD